MLAVLVLVLALPACVGLLSRPGRAQAPSSPRFAFADTTLLRDTLGLKFDALFEKFRTFVREMRLGDLRLNQWEVTYVNHLPKGTVWNSPADWQGRGPRPRTAQAVRSSR